MKFRASILVSVMVALFLVSAVAVAEETGPVIPNLVGKWTAEYKVFSPRGFVESSNVLTITEQDGPYFRGNHIWAVNKGPKGLITQHGKAITSEKEPIIGVIDFDGKTVRIIEKGDSGRFDGRVAGQNKLELVHTEGGAEAFVYRAVFTRQEK
ncbi:MAG: hypothetical protein EG822_13970 [Deltaproteobacteria bacterium]|nr:hypothetical protein [Deltaproteobacteria bacterium]TLN01241.1 MAG: hypothetical protein FDZ73_16700 [bacterium]